MIDLISLATTGLAFFIVAVSPGPATISNATIAMNHGRKVSLKYGAGLSSGLVIWGVIAVSGMGAILQTSVYLLSVLKILGGLYLLWLAFLSARATRQPESKNIPESEDKRWFLRGLLLNLSNPKSLLAWMAALSVGLNSNDNIYSISAALAVCIGVGFFTNAMYSVLFSIDGIMQAYQRCQRSVNGIVAGLFAVAGFGLIRSAFNR